jgi:DNA modification methylase
MNNPELPRNRILIGDVRTRLPELPDAAVDCVITSPPYFALRDYGQAGQLGLEPTVDDWVAGLVAVSREIRRVLKPGGSYWLNVADSYAHHPTKGTAKKSLLLGPQRLALALAADGWVIRNHIIWSKTNPMPSNVQDRLATTHESIFFLTRRQHYYFDLNTIRQSLKERPAPRSAKPTTPTRRRYPPAGTLPRRTDRAHNINSGLGKLKASGRVGHPLGGNPGDVWRLATAAYRGAHFASFPQSLVERPLLATCPERVCQVCGTPWQRARQFLHGRWLAVGPLQPDCGCGTDWQPGVVLDPFLGSGTVALVAEQRRRDWVGVEINPAYAALAAERLQTWRSTRRRTG